MPELEGMRSVTLVINRETSMEHTERLITALSHLSTTFLDENPGEDARNKGAVIMGAADPGEVITRESFGLSAGCEEQGSSRSSTLFNDSVQGVKLSDESHQD
ncbi:hypothetical protein B296_00048322, partial [Ensete ventricosum]